MRKKLLSIAILLTTSSSLFAAEAYNPQKNYSATEQVQFNGNIFEAQWWVNQNESPAHITQNSWESPWVFISESESVTPEDVLPLPPLAEVTPNIEPESQVKYVQIMNEMAAQMVQRVNELKKYAQNPDFYFFKNGKKFIEINGIDYEVDAEHGTPIIPLRNWADDSATRNLFSFFDQDWEFSMYEGGAVVVNKTWGNYDWGNGCVLEYLPNGHLDSDYVLNEALTCMDGSDKHEKPDATSIAPYKFGVDAAHSNMVSIEQLGDKLIVAQSPSAGDSPMVGIYDTKANTTTKILGISKAQPYKGLDDLRSHKSQLFVSAIGAHDRIDVFNGDTNQYQYSYDVQHNGNSKIAVNDQYILVADAENITVYHNTPAALGETKSLQPFAHLAYVNGRPFTLEFIGSKLLTGGSQGSAIYDLDALSQGTTLQPLHNNIGAFESMDANDKYIFVKENNGQYVESTTRFAMYDIQQFIANDYQFKDAAKAVYLLDHFWVSGHDLVISNNEIITLTNSIIESVPLDKLDTLDFTQNAYVPTAQLEFDALPQTASVRKILQDGLAEGAWSISANTDSMVNIRLLDRNTVEITNFTDIDLKNVDLDIKAHSQHNWARLANLDKLPAYTRITMPITDLNTDKSFNTVDGTGVYNYTGMLSTLDGQGNTYGHYGTQHLIDSRFATETKHPLLDKLNKITAAWDITFTDMILGSTNTETPWDANSIKRHIKLLTNVAYIVSSETFKNKLMNYKENYGHDLYLYGTTFETKAQKESLLNKTLHSNGFANYRQASGFQNTFSFGKTAGTVFGLSDQELNKVDSGDMQAFALYLGEQIGQNWYHDCPPVPCNWTEIHFAKLFVDVYNELDKAGELPY
ncbi:hypothetical protein [Photobacterium phosphoreum]|uniref:hypothetical protein n=1 Tax=Photobacterium phosphoreum TaxID=659 RepID=UPI000D175439|nr:hypothetical protein [Photobacterium phosphoreum]MCD9501865.1 hypothetical protein [Photobacterium phosphoreum]PSU60576.1 hypothetical protein CTM80_14605 [Photobacterium phosphoreum]